MLWVGSRFSLLSVVVCALSLHEFPPQEPVIYCELEPQGIPPSFNFANKKLLFLSDEDTATVMGVIYHTDSHITELKFVVLAAAWAIVF